jgi:(1->4)-alpha-D-glucan 1-alpha-D-glucosylmutase
MTTLSTHDTKRQEDVRARLAVLAEMPEEWGRQVDEWHSRALSLGAADVDRDTEYLLWQTLVGAWPVCGERLAGYLEKAMREAKTRTSWISPDPRYEAAVQALAAKIVSDDALPGSIEAFVAGIAPDAFANSLGVKLVQLTMPGVPDVYQGCELTGLSLVDPDNRRPVDFARRRALLAGVDADADPGVLGSGTDLDAAKLLVTSRVLRLRRDHPDWFDGGYAPLSAAGPAAGHVVAFQRGGQAVCVATRLPGGLRRRGGWSGTVLPLPPVGPAPGWTDVLTGRVFGATREVPLAELTRRLPVALLIPEVS